MGRRRGQQGSRVTQQPRAGCRRTPEITSEHPHGPVLLSRWLQVAIEERAVAGAQLA
jgi:hypothetical protein